jgi:uncharacterized protein YndB with AHSA1/START domain
MPDIVHRVGIDAKAEEVFAALTTLDGLRGWWVSTAKGKAGSGGTIDFGFCKMKVVAAQPGKLVHWRCTQWATFLLSLMELVERGSGRPAPHDLKIHVGD